jgi:hypothetical protein
MEGDSDPIILESHTREDFLLKKDFFLFSSSFLIIPGSSFPQRDPEWIFGK